MHKPLKFSVWFSVIIAAVFVVAWLWIRESSFPGPYDLEPVNIVRNANGTGSTLNEVEGWQTYRNEEYGFEVKYPKDWKIFERDSNIDLRKGENVADIYFELTKNPNRVAYIESGTTRGVFKLANLSWKSFWHSENNPGEQGDFRTTLALTISRDGGQFIIRLTPDANQEGSDNEFDAILATFKFVK